MSPFTPAQGRDAAVLFAVGTRPGLNTGEAVELAELLERHNSAVAVGLAVRIRTAAARHAAGADSGELDLYGAEEAELTELLSRRRPRNEQSALRRLRAELAHHRGTR